MPLTDSEQKSFTTAKLVQLSRLDKARLEEMLTPASSEGMPERSKEDVDAHRAKVVGQLANKTPAQLRVRVNCLSFGAGVTFAPECDYTVDEQAAINAGFKANVGRKAEDELPAILAARTELLTAGFTEAQAIAILRNR